MAVKKSLIFIFFTCFVIISCKKEKLFTDSSAKLDFSTDTVQFDTVFTTIGSATLNFKVYNSYNQPIKISSIRLAKGNTSFFRLNINGISTRLLNDVELDAKDSMYIFVEVHVDPLNSNNPLVVQDSIVFETNGNFQDIKLVAFGQDVNLINGKIIQSDTTWTNLKPFLVYNSMLVDSGVTLNILSGTKIYFHKDSRLYVLGTLNAQGNKDEPILFRNDRLEHWYDDVPGQWAGIYFATAKSNNNIVYGSRDNILNYCEIKNAIIGVQVDTTMNSDPTVIVSNTKILNMNAVGIYGQGAYIQAYNNVIANCGQFAVAITFGGKYQFYHCTIYNTWQYANRQTPSVLLNNYYQDVNGVYQVRPLNEATFINCIIYGNLENEVAFDAIYAGTFNYLFKNTLLKIADTTNTNNIHYEVVYKNNSPGLKNPSINDFSLDSLSFCIDKGDNSINQYPFNIDILENFRDSQPDLGAYERQNLK